MSKPEKHKMIHLTKSGVAFWKYRGYLIAWNPMRTSHENRWMVSKESGMEILFFRTRMACKKACDELNSV